jgi:aminoglycoside phosphotransferase (APT) family kinase protein
MAHVRITTKNAKTITDPRYNANVSPIYQPNFQCEECGAILRDVHDSFQADQQDVRRHLHETAQSSDRDLEAMRNVWLSSLGKMPDDERLVLWRTHYPRSVKARRTRLEHEASTGHSVSLHGWRTLLVLPGSPSDSK